MQPRTIATDINSGDVQKLTHNQRANVKGVITLGELPPKEVMKRNGQIGKVKEDCIIEDDTCYSTIPLSDDINTNIQTSKYYTIKKLSVIPHWVQPQILLFHKVTLSSKE